jgi:hypothetical protein
MSWTDSAEALGTVGAVVASLGVTWWTTQRADRQVQAERARSDKALREERERADLAQRVARDLALLSEVYDLYAEHIERRGLWNNAARLKVQVRCALLPETVATTIRSETGGPSVDDSDAKRQWLAARAGRAPEEDAEWSDSQLDLLQAELPADTWYLSHDRPDYGDRSWWLVYEETHPPVRVPTELQQTES